MKKILTFFILIIFLSANLSFSATWPYPHRGNNSGGDVIAQQLFSREEVRQIKERAVAIFPDASSIRVLAASYGLCIQINFSNWLFKDADRYIIEVLLDGSVRGGDLDVPQEMRERYNQLVKDVEDILGNNSIH